MKTLTTLIVMVFVTGSSGFLIKVPAIKEPTVRTSSMGWIHMQKLLLPLFDNVCEASTNPTIVRMANEFATDSLAGNYMNPEVYTSLIKLYTANSQLKKGEIFTELNQDHMYEFQLLFEVLNSAQNFDTFYNTAAWARQNTNCGLFVNAIYLAILKRRDTERVAVPAPYELLPHYFVRQDIIIKASSILAGADVEPTDGIVNEGNSYILDANYTCNADANDDSKLAYFHEDVGLNAYYYLKRLEYAPWFHSDNVNSNYGEFMYHFMKQLSSRYNLERYSNGMTPLDKFDWTTCNVNSYDPMLVFSDGENFSPRQTPDFTSTYYVTLKNIEDNIMTVIPTLVQNGYTKAQIVNNLMNLLVSNLQNYESEARSFFGDVSVENRNRSVLAHYMTSLRDPIFWRINKKIVNIIDGALKTLPGYSRNELYFPGVQVLNVEVKKIMTMFESFKFDVTDSLKTSTDTPTFDVNLVEKRLSHKSFSMKVNISSLISQKGLVKIYLGPKILPGEFAMKKDLFMLLDSFEYNLKIGSNVITRPSTAIEKTSEDFVSLKVLRKLVEDAEFGLEILPQKSLEALSGFPSRLILPKGTPEGLPVQLLVFVAPFTKITAGGINVIPKTEFNSATLAPGYPFDLDFDDTQFFSLPNVLVKDITITHKDSNGGSKSEYDGTKTWGSGDYANSYGPKREPYNYNLKNSLYVKDNEAKTSKTPTFNENVVTNKIQDNKNSNDAVQSFDLNRVPHVYNLLKSSYAKDYATIKDKSLKFIKDVLTPKSKEKSSNIDKTANIDVDAILHKNQDRISKVNGDEVVDKTVNKTRNIDIDVIIHKNRDQITKDNEDEVTDENENQTPKINVDVIIHRSQNSTSNKDMMINKAQVVKNYEDSGKGNVNIDKKNVDFSSITYDRPNTLSLKSSPYKKHYESKTKEFEKKENKYSSVTDKDTVGDTIPKSEIDKLENKQVINKNVDIRMYTVKDEQKNVDAMKSVIENEPETKWIRNVEEMYKRVIPENVFSSSYDVVTPVYNDEYIYE